MSRYVPEAGDLVWLTFDPQAGHEQAGRRPALILSPRQYNRATRLAVACPITSQQKGYPFEVLLPSDGAVTGAILADHLKSLDWQRRRATFIDRAPDDVMLEVRARLRPLLAL